MLLLFIVVVGWDGTTTLSLMEGENATLSLQIMSGTPTSEFVVTINRQGNASLGI